MPNDDSVAIADSGASGHYLTVKCTNITKWKSKSPISVKLPNGTRIFNSHEVYLPISSLPQSACLARIFPELTSVSLILICQLCDAGCKAKFDDKKVVVTKNNKTILTGSRNHFNKLWDISISSMTDPTPTQIVPRKPDNMFLLNNVFQLSSHSSVILYLHAACFFL